MQNVPPSEQQWSDEEIVDDMEGGRNDSDSDESEWGTVNGSFRINGILGREDGIVGEEDEDEEEEKLLYIPEPVVSFTVRKKPDLPRLPVESIPIGSYVWIVDEDDVRLLLREHWYDSYRSVCNGRLRGTVVRHSVNVALVSFYDCQLNLKYSLSLPRVCLSITPIEAYNRSLGGSSRFAESYCGIGNLDPRVGRFRDDAVVPKVNRQFYESLSVMEVQVPQSLPQLSDAQNFLNDGEYEKALKLLDKILLLTDNRVDVLVLRSRANIFLSRYEEALKDAQEVIKEEPCWVKGYLAAARALSGLCEFEKAARQIDRAMLLLPHSQELRKIEFLNDFMLNLQKELPNNELNIYLDFQYAKKLVTCRLFKKNEVLYKGDHMILAIESIFSPPSSRCCVCLRPGGTMMRVPIDLAGKYTDELACFCSVECQQRSSLFFAMELGRHRVAVERARDLISCNHAQGVNQVPLDMTYMTTRLFLMICVTHDRLLSQRRLAQRQNEGNASNISPEENSQSATLDRTQFLPIQAALKHLGVYPLPTEQLTPSSRDKMHVVYNTVTAFFSDKDRQIYSSALFYGLYEYVRAFIIGVNVPQTNTRLYYLPKLMGAVRRAGSSEANCNAVLSESGNDIALIALRDLSTNEVLSVPDWTTLNRE